MIALVEEYDTRWIAWLRNQGDDRLAVPNNLHLTVRGASWWLKQLVVADLRPEFAFLYFTGSTATTLLALCANKRARDGGGGPTPGEIRAAVAHVGGHGVYASVDTNRLAHLLRAVALAPGGAGARASLAAALRHQARTVLADRGDSDDMNPTSSPFRRQHLQLRAASASERTLPNRLHKIVFDKGEEVEVRQLEGQRWRKALVIGNSFPRLVDVRYFVVDAEGGGVELEVALSRVRARYPGSRGFLP